MFVDTTNSENFANSTTLSTDDGTIIAKKKNRPEFMGMFQCSVEDDPVIARNLIIGNSKDVFPMLQCVNLY